MTRSGRIPPGQYCVKACTHKMDFGPGTKGQVLRGALHGGTEQSRNGLCLGYRNRRRYVDLLELFFQQEQLTAFDRALAFDDAACLDVFDLAVEKPQHCAWRVNSTITLNGTRPAL